MFYYSLESSYILDIIIQKINKDKSWGNVSPNWMEVNKDKIEKQ